MDPASPLESQSCPLHFHDFRPLDPQKNCTIYCSLIGKEDSVSLSDLEQLHAELLLMREDVEKRIGLIESETTVLGDWQVRRENKKRRHSDTGDTPPTGPGRPRKTHDAPVSKRHKGVPSSDTDRSSSRKSKSRGGIITTVAGTDDGAFDDDKVDRTVSSSTILKSKAEMSDRFWSTVEPYCANITEEDLQNLYSEEALDPSHLYVPPLGSHYSLRWSSEDMMDEKMEGGKAKGLHPSAINRDTDSMLEEGGAMAKTNQGSYGPLTLRLMASFIDEPGGSHQKYQQQKTAFPSLSSSQLETRIKEELTSLGLIDPPVEKDNKSEDEILTELKKVQAELRSVSEYNQQQSHRLASLARAEMQRQVVRDQLEEVDRQVMDWLTRFTSYHQKKRREPISRKEREAAVHALEERVALLDQI